MFLQCTAVGGLVLLAILIRSHRPGTYWDGAVFLLFLALLAWALLPYSPTRVQAVLLVTFAAFGFQRGRMDELERTARQVDAAILATEPGKKALIAAYLRDLRKPFE
ncbi:MAG: hypothetical protein AAF658_03000 [Myxococcota bacterium]